MSDRQPKTHVVELTPPGRGAVAVVLVAGPESVRMVDACFRPASGGPFRDAKVGRIVLGRWGGPKGEELIACRRGDDTVEIHCHGGIAAVRGVVGRLCELGAARTAWRDWVRRSEPDPLRADAQIALAEAFVADGQKERAARIARSLWTENFLDKGTEALVLDKLGSLLDRDAHWTRAMHLMMHDRASGVERLMSYMTPAQKSLATARNAVSRNAKNAKKLLDDVDPSMQSHPVFLFSRAQRARQFELWDDAIAWLDKAKGDAPDAAEFWYERRTLIRQLLGKDDAKRAYLAAAHYTEGPEGRLVEARFHAGWIALAFLKEPKAAIPEFQGMIKYSTLPDSVTQAYYWLGRAKMAAGDKAGATAAYQAAAQVISMCCMSWSRAPRAACPRA